MKGAPYVISADIRVLLTEWAAPRGFILPPEDFFASLRKRFCQFMESVFGTVDLVAEAELEQGLGRLVRETSLPAVSLDRVYFPTCPNLDLTRLVDTKMNDAGLGERQGAGNIVGQVETLRNHHLTEIVLVDDVVFSGTVVTEVITSLNGAGIKVPLVCAGIGVGPGVKKISSMGSEARCVRFYEEVIDEVCERDFYPGTPLSGRLMAGGSNTGFPYLLPFGDPGKWASIPEPRQAEFSRFCLKQTIELFREIEARSGKLVRCQDLSRHVVSLPRDGSRFVEELCQFL